MTSARRRPAHNVSPDDRLLVPEHENQDLKSSSEAAPADRNTSPQGQFRSRHPARTPVSPSGPQSGLRPAELFAAKSAIWGTWLCSSGCRSSSFGDVSASAIEPAPARRPKHGPRGPGRRPRDRAMQYRVSPHAECMLSPRAGTRQLSASSAQPAACPPAAAAWHRPRTVRRSLPPT